MAKRQTWFLSGIDTDAGKTYVTAALVKYLFDLGKKVTSFKLIQTGSPDGRSIDIDAHRKLAEMPESDLDRAKLTYPEVYTYPASPHLAAELDGRPIDFNKIEAALKQVESQFDYVIVEGAGGLMVPLTRDLLTIDYAARQNWPLLLVTSGKLGSINHTLLSLEAAAKRGMKIAGVLYNAWPEADPVIGPDTIKFLREYIGEHYPECAFCLSPYYQNGKFCPTPDFSGLFTANGGEK